MPSIRKSRILVMATDGFEQSELEYPVETLKKHGAQVTVASPDGENIRGWDKNDWGRTTEADAKIGDLSASDFDAVVLPGGQINPDILRTIPEAVRLLKDFDGSGKPVAAICHGPWMLVEADMLRGREATSYASIATDLKNAGARWKDAEVVVDQGIITSRSPADLEAFVAKIVEEVEEGRHDRDATGARAEDPDTGHMTRGFAKPGPEGTHYDDTDNRDTTSLPGAGGAASGQGREGGRLARDIGSRDELKRATERPAGATRVRKSDEEEETR